MTELAPTGDWDGRAFAHEGFTFGTDQELLDRLLPFTVEGLSRDEPVLVVAGERVRTLLAQELGGDLARLTQFTSAEEWWRGPHGTLLAYDRDIRRLSAAVPSWRLAGEPVWLARDEGRVWSRFEAVVNRCFAQARYYSLCLHDAERLPADVLAEVARTHPLRWGGSAPVPTGRFEDPAAYLRSVQQPLDARPADVPVRTVLNAAEARRVVRGWLADEGHGCADRALPAAHELVTNALRVSATAELACWSRDGALVVEVADHGPGLPDETAGYVPPGPEPAAARGMWLAWSLADDAAVATGDTGTRIQLRFRC